MAINRSLALALIFCISSCCISKTFSASSDDFLHCLSLSIPHQLIYTKSSPSYTSILVSSIRNPRFLTSTTPRPLYIITPTNTSHIQTAVLCGRRHDVRIRVRSGGHDYEGLSYRSERPELFAVVDLSIMRSVHVDSKSGTAWVDSGATIGELYYAISKTNSRLAFPAGVCPSIGVGGHFSGGGFGMMLRKYGLAVDHVLDATLVDANGNLLDKDAMGEDLFWAVRGGGGESFGIVVSWLIKLVPVPETVTVFSIQKTLAQGAIDIITKWQELAPTLPEDLMIRMMVQQQHALFQSLYLGTCDELLPLMSSRFPELGMNRTYCNEMSWIESVPYIHYGKASMEALLNRTTSLSAFTKNKSDYLRQTIPREVWEKIYAWLAKAGAGLVILDPYGAQMSGVPDSATPYPHRNGVLFNIQYITFWTGDGTVAMKWIRDFYAFMEPYVSKNPREAYVNYRDLDLGENVVVGSVTSYESGKVWGEKYFKGNFERLAVAKGKVDPDDYFRNEQSIPPLK